MGCAVICDLENDFQKSKMVLGAISLSFIISTWFWTSDLNVILIIYLPFSCKVSSSPSRSFFPLSSHVQLIWHEHLLPTALQTGEKWHYSYFAISAYCIGGTRKKQPREATCSSHTLGCGTPLPQWLKWGGALSLHAWVED